MKRFKKLFTLFAALSIVLGLSLTAHAAEEAPNSLDDVAVVYKYTSDSVVSEGISFRAYSDPISGDSGIELIPDFGIGYAIYDNPDTEIIDGIRINGSEVTSLRIPIDPEHPVHLYEIAVRTVYVDTASGTLAQILDGTYDYTQLLTNPVIVLQLCYWVFMALSGIFGFIILIINKSKKVKTSEEIAGKVAQSADELQERITQTVTQVVTDIIRTEIMPLAQASVNSGKDAVKAIVISTSKSKEAPAALLDVLQHSTDIDLESTFETATATVAERLKNYADTHSENVEALRKIATNVIQENSDDANKSKTPEESVEAQTSIF